MTTITTPPTAASNWALEQAAQQLQPYTGSDYLKDLVVLAEKIEQENPKEPDAPPDRAPSRGA